MLKNQVIEKTGVNAYALFSDAAARELNLTALCNPLIAHSETYEHLGEVKMQVHDLRTTWNNHLKEKRLIVDPETLDQERAGDSLSACADLGLHHHARTGVNDPRSGLG